MLINCYKSVQSFRIHCLFIGQFNTEGYDTITDAVFKAKHFAQSRPTSSVAPGQLRETISLCWPICYWGQFNKIFHVTVLKDESGGFWVGGGGSTCVQLSSGWEPLNNYCKNVTQPK